MKENQTTHIWKLQTLQGSLKTPRSTHIYFISAYSITSVQPSQTTQPYPIYYQFIIIPMPSTNAASDSIPLQTFESPTSPSLSQWLLNLEDIWRHAKLHHMLHPQSPKAAWLSMKKSHPYTPKSYAIGDSILFQDDAQPFTFLGYTGKVVHNEGREEYKAEFQAPYPTNPPTSICLNLHHRVARDRIWLSPPCIQSWEWIKEKLRSYFCCWFVTLILMTQLCWLIPWLISEKVDHLYNYD